jgi:chromosome segregation ATPase
LENSVRNLTNEKNKYFDQLQLRQGEYESAESHSQSLEAQTNELQYQLREATERIALLTEELSEARRDQEHRRPEPSVSAEEIALTLQATEARYEGRLKDVRSQVETLETERADAEVLWARRLEEKAKEVEQLRKVVNSSKESSGKTEESVKELKQQAVLLKEEARLARLETQKLHREAEAAREAQVYMDGSLLTMNSSLTLVIQAIAQEESTELNGKLAALDKMIEEIKSRESQLKAANKVRSF